MEEKSEKEKRVELEPEQSSESQSSELSVTQDQDSASPLPSPDPLSDSATDLKEDSNILIQDNIPKRQDIIRLLSFFHRSFRVHSFFQIAKNVLLCLRKCDFLEMNGLQKSNMHCCFMSVFQMHLRSLILTCLQLTVKKKATHMTKIGGNS